MVSARVTFCATATLLVGLTGHFGLESATAQAPSTTTRPQSNVRRAAPPKVAAPRVPGATQPARMPAAANAAPVGAQMAQLTPEEAERLDQLLTFWETQSSKVNTYSCKFTRYEYDHVFGPKDPRIAKSKSVGIIRYASPDKGEFKIERALEYKAATAASQKAGYQPLATESNEHWICDGTSIYELNGAKKQLIQQQLPPELQGKKIADGPLPFMFGAEKAKLQQRYWIREVKPPAERQNEYWFVAYPKTREDAASYQKLRVILDGKNFLPTALEVYPPNYDVRTNPSRTVYTFEGREVDSLIHRGRQFFDRFISPKTPRGWKKVVMQFGVPANGPTAQTAAQGQGHRQ